MLLSILIASLSSRKNTMLESLLEHNVFGLTETVEYSHYNMFYYKHKCFPIQIIVCEDGGVRTSGSKRQELLESAKGEYICFADDDDIADKEYVSALYSACFSNVDIITFNLAYYHNQNRTETWHFGLYPNHRRFGFMCANHLCAWRRYIAMEVAWCPELGYGDDRLWFEPLINSGKVVTQFHINKELYHYYYSDSTTINQRREAVVKGKSYVKGGLKCFLNSFDEILIQVPDAYPVPDSITLRDKDNRVWVQSAADPRLKHYHTIR